MNVTLTHCNINAAQSSARGIPQTQANSRYLTLSNAYLKNISRRLSGELLTLNFLCPLPPLLPLFPVPNSPRVAPKIFRLGMSSARAVMTLACRGAGLGGMVSLWRWCALLVDGYSLLHNWPELRPGQPRH